jgi:formiminotetrahydrofolate cyclodeaminase
LGGAALNVRANAKAVSDRATAEVWLTELAGLEARAQETLEGIKRALRERK